MKKNLKKLASYCVIVLIYTSLQVTATMKLANIWLQKNRRRFGKTFVTNCCRWNKFAWCDSSWWQIRGILPGWRLYDDIDKLAKFLKSSPNIHQIPQTASYFAKLFLFSPCYHNTMAMMLLVVYLHLQVRSTTMQFKQAYSFLISIHLQILVTTVWCQ